MKNPFVYNNLKQLDFPTDYFVIYKSCITSEVDPTADSRVRGQH